MPMMMLVQKYDPAPEMRPPSIDSAKREEGITMRIAGATRCYGNYEAARCEGVMVEGSRRRHKLEVGRNEPCLYGSGRKCLHCCALNLR